MRIAITAPTGNVGRKVVNELLARGQHHLVLLSRHPDKLKDIKDRGVKLAHGDLTDPDFVEQSLHGIDALFYVIPPNPLAPDLRTYQAQVARIGATAAKNQHVKHVVLLSSLGADKPAGTGPILGLHDAEDIFSLAVPSLTILRPASFMENYLMQVDSIRQAGSVFLPISGDVRVPMIATEDIARAAADALISPPPHGRRIINLVGPRPYTFDEAARVIGQTIGRTVQHVKISDEQARETLLAHGTSVDVADRMVEMYDGIDHGPLHDAIPQDATRTPTNFEQFAQSVLKPALAA